MLHKVIKIYFRVNLFVHSCWCIVLFVWVLGLNSNSNLNSISLSDVWKTKEGKRAVVLGWVGCWVGFFLWAGLGLLLFFLFSFSSQLKTIWIQIRIWIKTLALKQNENHAPAWMHKQVEPKINFNCFMKQKLNYKCKAKQNKS